MCCRRDGPNRAGYAPGPGGCRNLVTGGHKALPYGAKRIFHFSFFILHFSLFTFRCPARPYASKVYVRYWMASATWAGWISSLAARSAMVRATRRMRS